VNIKNPLSSLANSTDENKQNGLPKIQKKVLVVEDEAPLAEALKLKLTNEGYEVEVAGNGVEGLAKISTFSPGVIILDLMMPIMDGKKMLNNLRENPLYKLLPVIILTNAGTVDNMTETVRYNDASAFLIKSNTSLEEIINHVKKFLG